MLITLRLETTVMITHKIHPLQSKKVDYSSLLLLFLFTSYYPLLFHSLKKHYHPSISYPRAKAYIFTDNLKSRMHGLFSLPNAAAIMYFSWMCFMLLKLVNTLSPLSFPGLCWQSLFSLLGLSKCLMYSEQSINKLGC